MSYRCKTPIIFFNLGRPEATRRVLDVIRKVQPERLFVVLDGARSEAEEEKRKEVKQILENINWDCEVRRNYSEKNIGLRQRIPSGIDWAFENTDKLIILEDDTLPHELFFPYCEELLYKYENNDKVMNISGVNFQNKLSSFKKSYHFSYIAQIWGWATWRRAWNKYDGDMQVWPQAEKHGLMQSIFGKSPEASYWRYLFDKMYQGKKNDNWDAQWAFTLFINKGLSINPSVNLVSNIGAGEGATHGADKSARLANRPAHAIELPLSHLESFEVDKRADKAIMRSVFRVNNTLKKKIIWQLKNRLYVVYRLMKWLKLDKF